MEGHRKTINEPNDINLLIRQNKLISPESTDLSWSRNSASVQMGEICSSIKSSKKPTRPTVPHLTVTKVM